MPPDTRVHVGVAAVVFHPADRDRLLMIRRGGVGTFASDGNGTWSVPGGWLDYGETPAAAACREAYEESGVNVAAWVERGFVCEQSESAPIQIVTLFIECRYISGEPRVMEPEKCPEVAWVPRERLDHLPLFAPLRTWHARGEI